MRHARITLWGTVEPVDDLVAFLAARLDEDETAARESSYEGQRWITEEEGVYRWPDDELVHTADRKADARHIARHDPARALRQVMAARAVLTAYEMSVRMLGEGLSRDKLMLVRAHAVIWEDHPDYRAEWAP